MKIAENLKCKDFTYKSRPLGSQLKGYENYYVCDIYLGNKLVHTCDNKTAARKWVSKKVKEVNAILEAARKQYGEK